MKQNEKDGSPSFFLRVFTETFLARLTFPYKSVILYTIEYKIERYAVVRTAFNREEGSVFRVAPLPPQP